MSLWTGRGGQLDNELVRRIMVAVEEVPYDDPGEYPGYGLVLPPPDQGIMGDAQDLAQVMAARLGPAAPPGCSSLGCD